MFHQETLLLAVALTFCRAYDADKNSLHVPKAVLRLARSLNTADNAIPEPYESYGQQNYKCISEGRFEDPNDCGQYYDCIQTDTGELVAQKKSCFGHGFDTTIKACAQTDMVKGCSLSPTERLRSFTFADPTLLKVCKDLKNEFMCSDCKTLVMCVNSRAYSVSCGQGLLCSSNKTEFTGGVCYPGAPSECTCNKDNSFRKDIYNPSKFLSCDYLGSDPEIHTCPNGAVFNEELITCGTHAESTCSISGSFAKMSDCNKYYTCILTTEGWLQKDFSCTDSSQMFNDKTGVCEDPCDWYTGDYIGHFDCTQEGRFANPGDCKTFYDCIKDPIEYGNFTRVEHRCPEGYEWGPIANRSFCVASSTATEECVPSKPNNCIIPSGWCSATTEAITEEPTTTPNKATTTEEPITTTIQSIPDCPQVAIIDPACPPTNTIAVGDTCFTFVYCPRNFSQARQFCSDSGWSLATPDEKFEQFDHVMPDDEFFWLDVQTETVTDPSTDPSTFTLVWYWQTSPVKTLVTDAQWEGGKLPTTLASWGRTCASIYKNFGLIYEECSYLDYFACESDPISDTRREIILED